MQTSVNEVEVSAKQSLIPIKLVLAWIVVRWHRPEMAQHESGAMSQPIDGSSLHKPASAKEDYSKGTVMAIGPGEPGYPIDVIPGQEVLYFRQEARPLTIKVDDKDQEFDLVTNSQMIAIL